MAPATSEPSSTILPDGQYTIGGAMQVGTYVASPTSSCYWARYDSSGATIANDFTQATRVQIVIEASDYSFSSQGCGGWARDTSAEDAASAYPDSPEAGTTKCSEYLYYDADERLDLAGRYLNELRSRDDKEAATNKLAGDFATEIAYRCDLTKDTSDYTVGVVALTAYDAKKFQR